jgi:hypothetical protein
MGSRIGFCAAQGREARSVAWPIHTYTRPCLLDGPAAKSKLLFLVKVFVATRLFNRGPKGLVCSSSSLFGLLQVDDLLLLLLRRWSRDQGESRGINEVMQLGIALELVHS